MVRFKNRYLLVEVLMPTKGDASYPGWPLLCEKGLVGPPSILHLTPGRLASLLRDALQEFFGDWGAGCCASSLHVKYLSPTTGCAIIRVARDHVRLVQATATLITHIKLGGGNKERGGGRGPSPPLLPIILRTVHMGGTMKKTQNALIEYNRALIARVYTSLSHTTLPQQVKDAIKREEEEEVALLEP